MKHDTRETAWGWASLRVVTVILIQSHILLFKENFLR